MANQNLAGTGQALDVSLPTILGRFRTLRETSGVVRRCATPFPLKRHTGTTANMINYNKATAYEVSDGVDLTQAHALEDTLTSFTPVMVGVKAFIPWSSARRVADPNLEAKVGTILHDAMDFKEDADGCDAFASFTNSLGSAGTVMSPGHLAAVAARLGTGNTRRQDASSTRGEPAPGPWHTIIHDYQALHVWGRLLPLTDVPAGTTVYGANTGANAGITLGISGRDNIDEMIRRGPDSVRTFSGMTVYKDNNINVDSSDDARGAAFSSEGLVYCEEDYEHSWEDKDDSFQHTEVGIFKSYVYGVYRAANYGFGLLFDASTPTS
jgi:hypothetical protein